MLFVKELQIFKLSSCDIASTGSKNITRMDILFCPKYSSDKGGLAN